MPLLPSMPMPSGLDTTAPQSALLGLSSFFTNVAPLTLVAFLPSCCGVTHGSRQM